MGHRFTLINTDRAHYPGRDISLFTKSEIIRENQWVPACVCAMVSLIITIRTLQEGMDLTSHGQPGYNPVLDPWGTAEIARYVPSSPKWIAAGTYMSQKCRLLFMVDQESMFC